MEEYTIMMIAIIQSRDSENTITALKENGFYVTVLSTMGGFLKQKNTTLLIGTHSSSCEQVKSILKEKAGKRKEPDYTSCLYTVPSEGTIHSFSPNIPPQIMNTVGGATVFTVNLEGIDKF